MRRSRTASKMSRLEAMFWKMGSTALESPADDVILEGLVTPDAAPPELRAVALLLDEARPAPAAGPLANETATVVAMREAIATAASPLGERRGSRRLGKLSVRAGIAAAALVLSASGAAAANGSLPEPAQRVVASALERVGVHVANPDQLQQTRRGVAGSASDTDRPPGGPSTTGPPNAATFGLCTAAEPGGSPPPLDCTTVERRGKPGKVPPGSAASPAAGEGAPPSSTPANPTGPPPEQGVPAPQASPKATAATSTRGPASTPPGRTR